MRFTPTLLRLCIPQIIPRPMSTIHELASNAMAPVVHPEKQELIDEILKIQKEYATYGRKRITQELQKRHPEWSVSEKRGMSDVL